MQKGTQIAGILRSRTRPWVTFFLFPTFFLFSQVLAADGPINPDDPAYLRRQYAWFQTQEPARQQQLRRLHADFLQLTPDEQARLTRVSQAYNAWLFKLPEADRQRILAASSAAERLDEVKRLREREWVESLPKVYRDEYATLDTDARRVRIQEWRTEEGERREEWSLAQKHWADNPPGKIPPVFGADRLGVEAFVTHLRENLSDTERKSVDDARLALDENGVWFGYGFLVVRLADQHPILPWSKIGSRDWRDLPGEVKTYLRTNDRTHFDKPVDMPREVRRAQGRWPEFAVELVAYSKKNNLTLPIPLGDCRKDQMPTELIQFLDKVFEPLLKKSGSEGRADLQALTDAQGKWPEYPKLVMDLARKYKQPVPGWTLPGQPQFWDRLRAAKGRPK
jgi:hypothetical protein